MVLAAKAALGLHIPHLPLLGELIRTHCSSSPWVFCHLETEVIIKGFQEPLGLLMSCCGWSAPWGSGTVHVRLFLSVCRCLICSVFPEGWVVCSDFFLTALRLWNSDVALQLRKLLTKKMCLQSYKAFIHLTCPHCWPDFCSSWKEGCTHL